MVYQVSVAFELDLVKWISYLLCEPRSEILHYMDQLLQAIR